ncbi:hypothetical protein V5799_020554 [Amblyomma americanum]|uniref:Uncharacterized protein n=1 Tax=Amblyomma americanum TaxID=6943 RepID=A0AAQ4ETI8_AMBAM
MYGGVASQRQLRGAQAARQGGQHAQGTPPDRAAQRGAEDAPPGPTVGNDGDRYDENLVSAAQRFKSRRRAGSGESPWSSIIPPYKRRYQRNLCTCFTFASCAFCLVGVATLALHVFLLLSPLINAVTPASTAKRAVPASPTMLPTTPLFSPPQTTLATTTSSTLFTTTEELKTTQSECMKHSPDVPGSNNLSGVLHWARLDRLKAPAGGPQPVYCIYNVSRFRRPGGYGFLPLDIPLSLCPGVVYWSWKLSGGKLTSRAKEFDERYGLAEMQNVARDQRVDVAVILTLGGYPEDSMDFHQLERDVALRQRLIQDVHTAYQRYSLAGINLHWVRNDEGCEDAFGGYAPRLTEFVRRLRWLVALNAPSNPFIVSAMVDPEDIFQMEFFRSLRNDLNLTFFRTHHLAPLWSFEEYCKNSASALHAQLDTIKPFFPPPPRPSRVPATNTGQYKGLCISLSLALHARLGYRLDVPAPPRPTSATPGYIALFEVCDTKLVFENWRIPVPGCVVKRSRGLLLNVTYAVEGAKILSDKMSMLGKPDKMCVLLYDVDFDNYLRPCAGTGQRWGRLIMVPQTSRNTVYYGYYNTLYMALTEP